MSERVVVIGAGLGGLSAALELRRRGFDPLVLERHSEVGGKASVRRADGFRWDEGPSILVMPWVYRELFEASGLDPDVYLPMKRLDPAFKVVLSDGRPLEIAASEEGLVDALARLDPADGAALPAFMRKMDRFAAWIGRSYCDRILENWAQVIASPLFLSAAGMPPTKSYAAEIDSFFRSPAVRELFYGFPTYSGFDPIKAPASLAIIPWTIIREGVWYPASGGIGAIPRAIAKACVDVGIEIRTGVDVASIERDSEGRVVAVIADDRRIETRWVVSNSDYVNTHRMLEGGPPLSSGVEAIRAGRAEPSSSFLTIQIGCDRDWDSWAHHLLVLTPGSSKVYDELFLEGRYPSDPPIYVNVTSKTDPDDAPPGRSNPFIVIGAPPLPVDEIEDRGFVEAHAGRLIDRLETAGLSGLRASIVHQTTSGPATFRDRFKAFRGSIYGLGNSHNILGGSFRPLNHLDEVPGLYMVGGGVQPGAGMPMVVQSGKITAERMRRDLGRVGRRRVIGTAGTHA
ncbi:MAG: phytoene desaturase family protein [Isosphaeraceae bacterium]|nr:phytoene desaturase family protein [Isosphaeraceae bacterium]